MNRLENFWRPASKLSKKQIIDRELATSEEDAEEVENEPGESVPENLMTAEDFLKKHGHGKAEEIYEYYYKAMTRKDREALSQERFLDHFFHGGSSEGSYLFGDLERGYLLGILKYGAFIPTHFAPKNIRTGVDLVKELGADKPLPVAMAITEDLEAMMVRIPGWSSLDTGFLSQFRGEEIEKKIVHNNHPEIYKLATGLLDEYLDEQRRWEDDEAEFED